MITHLYLTIALLSFVLLLSIGANLRHHGYSLSSVYTLCLRCFARAIGLHLIPEKHRRKLHFAILGVIAWDLIHVGMKVADFGFLMLSAMIEAETAADTSAPPAKPVSEYPSLRSHHRHAKSTIYDRDIAALDVNIPSPAFYLSRLRVWAFNHGITIRPWAERDSRDPSRDDDDLQGVQWDDPISHTPQIAIRDTLSPAVSLYVLTHEIAHAIGAVTSEYKSLSGKSITDTGIPCWISPVLYFLSGDLSAVAEIAGEIEADTITRGVFNLMRWNTDIIDHRLAQQGGDLTIASLACLQPQIDRAVDRLYCALTIPSQDARCLHAS